MLSDIRRRKHSALELILNAKITQTFTLMTGVYVGTHNGWQYIKVLSQKTCLGM